MITVGEFEVQVRELEEVVIIMRAPVSAQVETYDYGRKASGKTSVSEWLDTRIKDKINGLPYIVLGGEYSSVHGRTKLETLRQSYEH